MLWRFPQQTRGRCDQRKSVLRDDKANERVQAKRKESKSLKITNGGWVEYRNAPVGDRGALGNTNEVLNIWRW